MNEPPPGPVKHPGALASLLRAPGQMNWGAAALRATLTLGVLGALFAWLPMDALLQALRRLPLWLWFATLLAFALGHVAAAAKWRLLLQSSGSELPLAVALRAHAAGLFANLCLPSLVGGDLLRASLVVGRYGRGEAVAVASLTDRVLDTLGLLLLASLAAIAIPRALDSDTRFAFAASIVLCGGLIAALAALWVAPRLSRDRVPAKIATTIERVGQAALAMLARPGAALSALGISIVIQASFVALNATLASAIGLELPWAIWFLAWPLAKLVALLPISLGGIGVREAALASLLLPFGVDPSLAVAQSLIWETLLIALGVCAGLLAFSFGGTDATSAPVAERQS